MRGRMGRWEGGREGGAFACRQYAIWEEWSRHELGGELEREMRQVVPLIIAREGLALNTGRQFQLERQEKLCFGRGCLS